ncbi:DUF928 domain-containing protein [Lyngbya sp. CCY1209]|uniref:DUF928 domain-containing protein n=1 Tax=Lyngbya sp. CCY1209 TaxID=2886103 RepID=UPI002D1FC357|nr:DUF928 domain-containing protein [Lyngbya sp. CCY1209]MEB3886221.1 DUF928 domain-containing protein [Lyngbya sp. CCY1209]
MSKLKLLLFGISFVSVYIADFYAIANAPFPKLPAAVATEFDPPDRGTDGNRQGSSSRTGCPEVPQPLTALIPETNFGLTAAERPTFLFYVPYSSEPPREVELVLLDEAENEIFNQKITPAEIPGIISISLPDGAEPLEVGKTYRWQFSYICNPRIRAEDDYVEGAIERVAIDDELSRQLEAVNTPSERAELYAKAGLWYETLTELAKMRQMQPQNPETLAEWRELLDSVGLGHLAEEPLRSAGR